MLAYDENVHFWRIAIVTGVLSSRHSEIRGEIVRIAKTNTMLERRVNKLFIAEKTYHDTNQTEKARRREAAVVGEQKRKYEI